MTTRFFGFVALVLVSGASLPIGAQTDSSEFRMEAELRPRMELRWGYRTPRSDTSLPAFFVSQRTRLNLHYEHPKFGVHLSYQDVRTWGDSDARLNKGSTGLFEAYADWHFLPGFTLRAGRQRIYYHNQRLFAQNDWRQTAASHDGLLLRYQRDSLLHTELSFMFNQTGEPLYGTAYQPGFSNYKFLGIHYLEWRLPQGFRLTTLNAWDGFQDSVHARKTYVRGTSGGHLNFESPPVDFCLSAYYQYGKQAQSNKTISAYYLHFDLHYKPLERLRFKWGGEWLSGNRSPTSQTAGDFVPLYGVAHRFNGFMDHFIRFPDDTRGLGLVNPYLSATVFLDKKRRLSLQSDWHLFFAAQPVVVNKQTHSRYWGMENDWLLQWQLPEGIRLEWGLCWLLPTESLVAVKGGGQPARFNAWSYLMVAYRPTLFKYKHAVKG